ncbi:MAG: 50S ribosomal protein L11 methyltransferase [Gracilimonas sp.]|uniref:50S ribosomal protein L11 methyltransferase n=1 Tax=Gracilimonas sp. TaxID=1974203 RepID=UPI001B29709A|nr:50S ribosomal protein L11 methyltransferase [Gracilimonas sp.]MBO6586247.1 50S ribosomal protein L11 methyltransferase [Gracilimonas sp.]MBO6614904.1 50S ribosomal protein L11 methyltransferase [Gracilimonas sp.]
MEYVELRISLNDDFHELLIAELFDLDFEGFEQDDDLLIATIPTQRFDDSKREEIEKLLMKFGGESSILSEKIIPDQNWNETWERTIQPQAIGRFYVHPTWSTTDADISDKIELMIDPKMAFGTGYHATTRVMLEWLPEVISEGDKVLDAGTGTGILAIAALKLGAESAFGFDIDEWSETNARENVLLNKVENFEVKLGSTEVIPKGEKFDVILANINRNALIELIPELLGFLNEDGKLLLSGLLEEDEPVMLKQEALEKLTHLDTRRHKEWIAILFEA